jgi:hypothetical protein
MAHCLRGCELEQACTRLEGECNVAWQNRDAYAKPARQTPPTVIRNLLSEEEIAELQSYAEQMRSDGVHVHGGLFDFGDSHSALFLHHGCYTRDGVWRTVQQACSGVLRPLLARVGEVAKASGFCRSYDFDELNIRSIEYHTYHEGGGLMDRGHIDAGSLLTISVQLSHPTEGGRFTTTDSNGLTTHHELARGDGIILHSEQVHNVTPIMSGSRTSLVIELWAQQANRRDRFT